MFGKDEMVSTTPRGEATGFIDKGMRFNGKLDFEGTVRIDGNFKGEIKSEGTLIVGEGALVEAEINVSSAVIAGEIRGSVNGARRVELKAPGKMVGDIRTPTLIIGEGVVFDGNCVMEKKDRPAELRPPKQQVPVKQAPQAPITSPVQKNAQS
ncbi:MAG: polymer-forming cytoskeletal protein [Thermodesulfobacteriota bacterium]